MIRALERARLMTYTLTSFVPATASATVDTTSLGQQTPAVDTATRVGPFPKSTVKVNLSVLNNRKIHANPRIEEAIEALWVAKTLESPRLFNGTKLRLQSWRVSASEATPTLELACGITDYKSYLGTCCSELVSTLRNDGDRLHDGDTTAFLSRKIGVSAIVETSDARVALIERSNSVGVYQHLFDTPGGHPEPSAIPLAASDLHGLENLPDRRLQLENASRDALFSSIVDEVHEEINLTPAQMSEPLLLGVVWQSEAETPSFVFHLQTPCSAADVDALYRAGPQDRFESTQLKWITASDLISGHRLALTPAAQGSLTLWQQLLAFQRRS